MYQSWHISCLGWEQEPQNIADLVPNPSKIKRTNLFKISNLVTQNLDKEGERAQTNAAANSPRYLITRRLAETSGICLNEAPAVSPRASYPSYRFKNWNGSRIKILVIILDYLMPHSIECNHSTFF